MSDILDPSEEKLVDDVREHGFHSMGVGADAEGPNFRYSIGFDETLSSPEIIIFGLDTSLMHDMLWEMFRQIKAGAHLTDGARFANVIDGFDCIARPVHASQIAEYFGCAMWYRRYRGKDPQSLTAFQLFWPGAQQGLFPWEGACSDEVRSHQPALYLPREPGQA